MVWVDGVGGGVLGKKSKSHSVNDTWSSQEGKESGLEENIEYTRSSQEVIESGLENIEYTWSSQEGKVKNVHPDQPRLVIKILS